MLDISEYFLGRCSIPDDLGSDKVLGHPYNKTFSNIEEANDVLEIFRKTIMWLQDDEKERQPQLVVGIIRKNQLRLYYGNWLILSFNTNLNWLIALKTEFMEELLEHKCESFKDKIEGKEYTIYEVDDPNFTPNKYLINLKNPSARLGNIFLTGLEPLSECS